MNEIDKVTVRAKLEPRHEPYWGPTSALDERGARLGFRKLGEVGEGTGSWIVRARDENNRKVYGKLGYASASFGFKEAKVAALEWLRGHRAGVTSEAVTVATACEEYVADRRREKGEACAHDAQKRFDRTVYGKPFAAIPLGKLKMPRIKAWRDGLKLSKGSANRTLTALKAALNLAVLHRRVRADAAFEWAGVKPHKAATKRRDLFLDLEQRRALIEATSGALRDLVEAVMLTGARAGELTSAKRSQFDARTGAVALSGKTGRREVALPPAAVTLFERLAKGKAATDNLFVRDDGRVWAHSDWDELIRDAAKAAKLPKGVCLYTLRHSFITQALSDGMRTLEVARFVGTSVMMIEKHYGHIVATDASERLAKVVML
jgi:integrase